MNVICNIPFIIDRGFHGSASHDYFSKDRRNRFLEIGVVDIVYRPIFSIESYEYVVDVIGRDKLVDLVRQKYKEIRENRNQVNFNVQIELDITEEDLLYHYLKLQEDFDDFFFFDLD